jgi:hypothetical protein
MFILGLALMAICLWFVRAGEKLVNVLMVNLALRDRYGEPK